LSGLQQNGKVSINDPDRGISFLSMVKELLLKASALDIAVSYVQISGWVLIEQLIDKMDPKKIRLLITDQFAITHPEALRKTLERGIQVRSYGGNRIYHPKVYLVYDATGQPSSAIIGSANISESGLKIGVEAGVVLSNARLLKKLKNWFSLGVTLEKENRDRHWGALFRSSIANDRE
jgi:HKD family nuclease